MGPEAMRVAGIQQTLAQFGVSVNDLGNLAGPPNPWLPPVDGYRHLPEVQAWNQAVHDAVYCREQGLVLRVLWLDAHADFNTMGTTPTGNIHGMPVAILRGMGPVELTSIGGRTPAIDAGTVRQIGIRSVDVDEKRLVHEDGMEVFDMRNIDEHGMRKVMRKALEGVDEGTHLHVSFDVDFLDPMIAPGVGTTVQGGPTYREAQLVMEMIADSGRLGSLDVMELNPAKDHANRTAEVATDLIDSMFGKSTLLRLKGTPAG